MQARQESWQPQPRWQQEVIEVLGYPTETTIAAQKEAKKEAESLRLLFERRKDAGLILGNITSKEKAEWAKSFEKIVFPQLNAVAKTEFDKFLEEKAAGKIDPQFNAIDLIVRILQAVRKDAMQTAEAFDVSNNRRGFAAFFDLSKGITVVEGNLDSANVALDEKRKKKKAPNYERIFLNVMGVDPKDLREIQDRLDREKARLAELLDKDPTGFFVVGETLTNLKNSPDQELRPLIKEWVITGAQAAAKFHEIWIPHAAGLLKDQ